MDKEEQINNKAPITWLRASLHVTKHYSDYPNKLQSYHRHQFFLAG
jgi:hypothetical protein